MASNAPLVPKAKHTKASMFYGADEYLDELKKKYAHDHEIAQMKGLLPDGGDPHAAGAAAGKPQDKMMSLEKNDANRSKKTGRLFPTPNKPEPMPQELAFLFTKIKPEQMMYMWNIVTLIFITQNLMVWAYACWLKFLPALWFEGTLLFGLPFIYIAIQNIYICHDVMHGATFPPYAWQSFITHPFSDFISLPWEEFVLEHNRHHASTVDLLTQGEFGWDPEAFQYWMLEWTWAHGKKPFPIHPLGLFITAPLVPVIHFFGLNDTGFLFAMEWYMHFPDEGAGGKCNKKFWDTWFVRRCKHTAFTLSLWSTVFCAGILAYGLADAWKFLLTVSFFARIGFSLAWMFITNFTHSHPWNHFLASDPDRHWPCLHAFMAFVLGGRHRWNEMLFHDLHHAFPNAVGTLSQRGRFHGWEKVHDACVEVLARGLWKDNGDAETDMQKLQKKRSVLVQSRKGSAKK